MPSLNHYIPTGKYSRIRLNTCEGENHINRELRDIETGKWSTVETIKLDDTAALAVAHKIIKLLQEDLAR